MIYAEPNSMLSAHILRISLRAVFQRVFLRLLITLRVTYDRYMDVYAVIPILVQSLWLMFFAAFVSIASR